jgi:hypothetical protein
LEEYYAWCDTKGIIRDKVEYPGIFDGGLVGVKAKQPIKHREMILGVP